MVPDTRPLVCGLILGFIYISKASAAVPSYGVDKPESVAVGDPVYFTPTSTPTVAVGDPVYFTPTSTPTVAVGDPVYFTPNSTPTVSPDACAEKCNKAFDECRVKPGANHAVCAGDYSDCLGYSPFNNGGPYTTPTACKAGTTVTSAAKPTGTVSPDACAEKCNKAFDECRVKPGANHAVCAGDYSDCLGYSPFNNGGPYTTPTACKAGTTVSSAAKPTGTDIPVVVNGGIRLFPGNGISVLAVVGIAIAALL